MSRHPEGQSLPFSPSAQTCIRALNAPGEDGEVKLSHSHVEEHSSCLTHQNNF